MFPLLSYSLAKWKGITSRAIATRQTGSIAISNSSLMLDEQVGTTAAASLSRICGEFHFGSSTLMDAASEAINKRVFTLHNLQQPDAPPRKVIHQYLSWPNLNVPESSRGMLDLIRHVNNALTNGLPREEAEHGPIVLHCSASVGRTGGFIVVDSILDSTQRGGPV